MPEPKPQEPTASVRHAARTATASENMVAVLAEQTAILAEMNKKLDRLVARDSV